MGTGAEFKKKFPKRRSSLDSRRPAFVYSASVVVWSGGGLLAWGSGRQPKGSELYEEVDMAAKKKAKKAKKSKAKKKAPAKKKGSKKK